MSKSICEWSRMINFVYEDYKGPLGAYDKELLN